MGNACMSPADEGMPPREAARREAAARRQAEELRRAEAASPYSVGEEVVRRDGGSASGIGWKRGFVTQLVPGDRLDGSVVRVTASQTDPSARGFEWQEVMKSQLFFEKRPRKEWSTVEFPWGVVTLDPFDLTIRSLTGTCKVTGIRATDTLLSLKEKIGPRPYLPPGPFRAGSDC